jgi:uncharacterized protein YdhG (YjbR/CyaY superfamily)
MLRAMAAKKDASKVAKKSGSLFTPEERAAMRERVRELKAQASKADGEREVLEKIATMEPSDRALAKRVHAIVKANAPMLVPRTWYGMPAYSKGESVVCFFRDAAKFKTRYATIGFSDEANLDDGPMWATDFALKGMTSAEEERIAALVRKAVS